MVAELKESGAQGTDAALRAMELAEALEYVDPDRSSAIQAYLFAWKAAHEHPRALARARELCVEVEKLETVAKILRLEFQLTRDPWLLYWEAVTWIDAGHPDKAVSPLTVAEKEIGRPWQITLALSTARQEWPNPREQIARLQEEAANCEPRVSAEKFLHAARILRMLSDENSEYGEFLYRSFSACPQDDSVLSLLENWLLRAQKEQTLLQVYEHRTEGADIVDVVDDYRRAGTKMIRNGSLGVGVRLLTQSIQKAYSNKLEYIPAHLATMQLLAKFAQKTNMGSDLLALVDRGLRATSAPVDQIGLCAIGINVAYRQMQDPTLAGPYVGKLAQLAPRHPALEGVPQAAPQVDEDEPVYLDQLTQQSPMLGTNSDSVALPAQESIHDDGISIGGASAVSPLPPIVAAPEINDTVGMPLFTETAEETREIDAGAAQELINVAFANEVAAEREAQAAEAAQEASDLTLNGNQQEPLAAAPTDDIELGQSGAVIDSPVLGAAGGLQSEAPVESPPEEILLGVAGAEAVPEPIMPESIEGTDPSISEPVPMKSSLAERMAAFMDESDESDEEAEQEELYEDAVRASEQNVSGEPETASVESSAFAGNSAEGTSTTDENSEGDEQARAIAGEQSPVEEIAEEEPARRQYRESAWELGDMPVMATPASEVITAGVPRAEALSEQPEEVSAVDSSPIQVAEAADSSPIEVVEATDSSPIEVVEAAGFGGYEEPAVEASVAENTEEPAVETVSDANDDPVINASNAQDTEEPAIETASHTNEELAIQASDADHVEEPVVETPKVEQETLGASETEAPGLVVGGVMATVGMTVFPKPDEKESNNGAEPALETKARGKRVEPSPRPSISSPLIPSSALAAIRKSKGNRN